MFVITRYSELTTEDHVVRIWRYSDQLVWVMFEAGDDWTNDAPVGAGTCTDLTTLIMEAEQAGFQITY